MATTTFERAVDTSSEPTVEVHGETNDATTKEPKKGGRAKLVLVGLIAAAAATAGSLYVRGAHKESTDDAQVEGHLFNVSSRIGGRTAQVLVSDNQLVEAGAVLVVLEDDQQRAKVELAKADVAAAEAGLASAEAQLALTGKNVDATLKQAQGGVAQASGTYASSSASIAQAKADVVAAESRLKLAQSELERVKSLVASNVATQAELDTRQAAFDTAQATLDTARARLVAANAGTVASAGGIEAAKGRLDAAQTGPQQLELAKAAVALAEARVKQTTSALHLAELDLGYTKIVAPARGVISRRTVEVGQMVDPSRPLLAIVPKDDLWVVANFKEDQLGDMKPGQPVKVKLDTFGGQTFTAHVDSIAGASGARFALLPPDNASGNFTKVVQRIPVLIRFDRALDVEIRPGMSAEVVVDTKLQ
jgi:membrane fusion protein (multidrug efflux system)